MGLAKCAECGQPVSTTARVCPHCGYDPSGYSCTYCAHSDEDGCSYSDNHGSVCPAFETWDD